MKNLILVLSLVLICSLSFAQDKNSLEQFPNTWATALDKAQEANRVQDYLKLFALDLAYSNKTINFEGNVIENDLDYYGYENMISQFLDVDKLDFEMTVLELYTAEVVKNIGYISFSANYKAELKGNNVASGRIIFNMVLKWNGNSWIVKNLSSFNLNEELSRGQCPCNAQNDGAGNINTVSLIPEGTQVTKNAVSFEQSANSDAFIFTTQGRTFLWYTSGRVVELDQNEGVSIDLGTTSGTEIDAIKIILSKAIFPLNCSEMVELKL